MTNIGVVVVHGIGEQGRFEHLDTQVRGLINALRRRPGKPRVTVDIVGSGAAALRATQATWRTGPGGSIQIVVHDATGITRIHVHEVWWADVNEPYSLAKQLRFWAWGLSVWAYPGHTLGSQPTGASMFAPRPALGKSKRRLGRAQLFLVSCFFLLTSLTVGVATALLRRLLNLNAPDLVRLFANYLSSIKLYTQKTRASGDFLDTIGEPPRTSVRRRMIRTLAEVARQDYARWYVLAHSQGAVVAFNGLMEPAFGWPGYLDETGWTDLKTHHMAGRVTPGFPVPDLTTMVPAWPAWAGGAAMAEVAYRRRIFANFRGLMTYGAPIEKFAAIWPARVPVCREPAFTAGTRWLNVFDPVDPVSGVMKSWPLDTPANIPAPENFGYTASPILLLGHLKYLECPTTPPDASNPTLADAVAHWLMTDDTSVFGVGRRFFAESGPQAKLRRAGAALWSLFAFLAAALLAGAVWHILRQWFSDSSFSLNAWVAHLRFGGVLKAVGTLAGRTVVVLLGTAVLTALAGGIARLFTDRHLIDADQKPVPFTCIPEPYPDAP